MRIRTQLILSAALAGLVTVAVAIGLVHVTRQAQLGLDEQAESQDVVRHVANMLALTNEFAVYGGERVISQWRSRHAQLLVSVDDASRRHLPADPSLLRLRDDIGDLPSLFEKLVEIDNGPATDTSRRRRELLIERLLAETQEVVESRHRWATAIGQAQQRNQRLYTGIVLAAPAALLALLLSLGILISRRVLGPAGRLQAAATGIHNGDLTARCASDAQDELGDAARAVDAMALALQRQTSALQLSERRLRLITDSLPAFVAHIDADQRYTFVNAHFGRAGVGDPGTMIGRTLREVRGEGAYAELVPQVALALSGQTTVFETTQVVRDLPVHRHSTYVPDLDDSGTVRGFYALTIDITERRMAELAMARSEQRLLDLTNNIPAMVGYFDMDGRCQYANDTALRSQGLKRSDVPGISLRAALGESNYAQHEPYVKEAIAGRRSRLEGRVSFQGREAHFQAHLVPDRIDGGEQRGFYLMTFDITALKEAQQKQARVERQLRAITDNLPGLITYVDRNERYLFVNATIKEWVGVEPADLIGRTIVETMTPANYEQRREHMRAALAGRRVEFNVESEALGRVRSLQSTYIPDIQSDGSVAGVYTLSTDVTALKEIERQLSQLARIDALTNLPNRRQFEERLTEAVARSSRNKLPIALMFLDIDHFKSINDTWGHAAGDAVLKEFALRLKNSVRLTDTPARLAGDEFVVLLEGIHAETDAARVAEKLVAAVRQPFWVDGIELRVTTSVGIAYAQRPAPDSTLMECADEALYQAKGAGRDTFKISRLDAFDSALAPLSAF